MRQLSLNRTTSLFALSCLILTGLAMRLYQIADVPIGGHGDVSWIGINALDWLQAGIWPYYIYELYAPEPVIVYAAGLSIQVFGSNFFASRLPTVLASLLVVPAGFIAARYLMAGKPRGLQLGTSWLFALAYAVSFYPIILGKTGQRSQLFPFQLALLTALFAYAWHSGKRWAYVGSAIVLALANYTYIPARLLPILLCFWALHQFFADEARFKAQILNVVGMLFFAALLVTPQLVTYLQTPEAFFARSNQDAGQLIFISGLSLPQLLHVLAAKFGAQFGIFVLPWNGFYSEMSRPLLPLTLGIGAFVGIIAALFSLKDKSLWWPLTGILFMTLTDVVSGTQTAPHGLRMIGVLPFAFLLGSRGLVEIWQWLKRVIPANRVSFLTGAYVGLVVASVMAIGLIDFFTYHNRYIPSLQAQAGISDRLEASDVFITDLIKAHSSDPRPIMITWDDFTRANIVYLLSDVYPERISAVSASNSVDLPSDLTEALVVVPSNPFRPRHDGLPPDHDWQSWVMLYNGQMLMLPPTTQPLIDIDDYNALDSIQDWQGTTIAEITTVDFNSIAFQDITEANTDFSQELQLSGYTLPSTTLEPESDLWVTLFWRAINGAEEDYETYVQILNDQEEPVAQAHRWTLDGVYRTRLWPSDQLTPTRFRLSLPDDLPAGRYTLITGPYSVLRNQPLPVVDATGTLVAANARIDRLKVPLTETIPNLPKPDEAIEFADSSGSLIEMSGFHITVQAQTLVLSVNWLAQQTLTMDHTLFIHVVDANEEIVAQLDSQPRSGNYPTGIWDAGEVIPDSYQLPLNNLQADQYDVYIGWYTLPNAERLTATVNAAPTSDNRVLLERVSLAE